MGDVYKKIAFLVRKASLTTEQFRRHWREVHGPLVANAPGYASYRRRYIQSHPIGRGPVGNAFAYDGMAAFWLPEDMSNEAEFSKTATYRDRIRPDEENFIDMRGTVSMTAIEHVLKPGEGATKLVIVSARAPDTTSGEFSDLFDTGYVDTLLMEPTASRLIRGWRANHVIDGSFVMPGALPADGLAVDCVEELWFDTPADMQAAFDALNTSERFNLISAALFDPARRYSFRAEAYVYFDDGVPVAPAPDPESPGSLPR